MHSFLESVLYVLSNYSSMIVEGTVNTLVITLASFTLGFLLALPIALARVYGPKPIGFAVRLFVEIVRGTPMLLQLFIVYYALPRLGIALDPFTSAIIGIGINSAAYQSEYIRSCINAVPRGQIEAARSLGMRERQIVVSVILPIALRSVLPMLCNEFVYLLKYSSIASFLTVNELTYVCEIIGSKTFMYLEVYTLLALIYVLLSFISIRVFKYIEKRCAIPGTLVTRSQYL